MLTQFTAAAKRALIYASGWSDRADCEELETLPLLVGLLNESECRAAVLLSKLGIDLTVVQKKWPNLRQIPVAAQQRGPDFIKPFSREVALALELARQCLAALPQPLEFATEHILLGLALADNEVSFWLREKGLVPEVLATEIHKLHGCLDASTEELQPLDILEPVRSAQDNIACEKSNQASLESEKTAGLRVIDAAANRALEAIRVIEDYVRFVLDDRHLTELCKQLRHDLATALAGLLTDRLAARETQADVGTTLSTTTEEQRASLNAVVVANFSRLQESLRSLEEFAKVLDHRIAARCKQLRYRSYTLHRAVAITTSSIERLSAAKLYVLIDGRATIEAFKQLVLSLIEAGVGVLQLRDKQLDDRQLLERARLLSDLTRGTATLAIINDRPDVAVLAGADGVHLGQEDMTVKDARLITGPERLIGVSTHNIEQARQAVLDGANYIGCGPVFPSGTKQFNQFPGLEFLRDVAAEIRLPAFAIGGIDWSNIEKVREAGFSRVAVSGAILSADNPGQAARDVLAAL